jgi:hypothetical protein
LTKLLAGAIDVAVSGRREVLHDAFHSLATLLILSCDNNS